MGMEAGPLPVLTGGGQPSSLVFVDTETTRTNHPTRPGRTVERFRLGVAVSVRWDGTRATRRAVLKFTDLQQWWDWLPARLSSHRETWFLAHNTPFDWSILRGWEAIQSGAYKIALKTVTRRDRTTGEVTKFQRPKWPVALDRRPFILPLRHARGDLLVLDTFNYWQCPLRELGHDWGLEKLEQPPRESSDADWFTYCQRDTEIIERAVLGTMAEWKAGKLGRWQPSAPMLAMTCYRTKFYSGNISTHNDEAARRLERRSYFGGPCECYYFGTVLTDHATIARAEMGLEPFPESGERGPAWYLDVRSFYPSVMRGRPYPTSLTRRQRAPTLRTLAEWLESSAVVADVTLAGVVDPFPVRTDRGVIYPSGRFRTVLAGPELARAMAEGAVEWCHEAAQYTQAQLFTRWVDHWWAFRAERGGPKNPAVDGLAKLLLNSLSGKWAQKGHRWHDRPDLTGGPAWGPWLYRGGQPVQTVRCRSIGGYTQEHREDEEPPRAFPAISAYITSYGREEMLRVRRLCPPRSVLYFDTDGLLVLPAGYTALRRAGEVREDSLGKLRVKSCHETVILRGWKNYTVDGVDVIAGRKKLSVGTPGMPTERVHFEGPTSLLTRPPDGTVHAWTPAAQFPGGPKWQVLGPDGWAIPAPLGVNPDREPRPIVPEHAAG